MTDVYQVEKIVGKRWKGGRVQYKVKWEGYPYSQCTWEPLEHLQTVFELIDQYNESQQTTSKKSKKEKDEEHLRKKRKNSSESAKSGESSKSKKLKSKSSEKNERNNDTKDNSNKEQSGISSSQEKEDDGVITIEEMQKVERRENESATIYKKVITINKEFKAVVQIVKDGAESQITIPTSELRHLNPDILIDFYESKIKFTSRS